MGVRAGHYSDIRICPLDIGDSAPILQFAALILRFAKVEISLLGFYECPISFSPRVELDDFDHHARRKNTARSATGI